MVVLAIPLRSIWRSLFEKSLPPASRRARATIITPPLRDRRLIGKLRKRAACIEHRKSESHSTSRQVLEEEGSTPSAVITRFECLDRPGGGGLADRMLMQRKTFLRAFSVGGRGQISMGIVGATAEGRDPPLLLLPRHSRLFKNPTSISCKFYDRHGLLVDAAYAKLPSSRPSRRIRGQLISLMCHVR